MDKTMLEYALEYAGKGWPVFPLHSPRPTGCSCGRKDCGRVGKHPRTPNGRDDATTEPSQIARWWRTWPDANIGIATGHGMVVVDFDIDHEKGKFGDETLALLQEEHEELPETVMALTGGGGLHYFFRCSANDLTIGQGIRPGMDFRGEGGYVVAPPSLHASGNRYEWEAAHTPEDTELAELPEWMHKELARGKEQRKRRPDEVQDVMEGGRNQTLFSWACALRDKGLTLPAITAAIWEENLLRCKPPLSRREVETICNSTGRYQRGDGLDKLQKEGEAVRPPDYSDAGNAEVLVRKHREDLIFTDALGWLCWNGKKWERSDHKAASMAISLSREMLWEATKNNREALAHQADAKAKYAESGGAEDSEAAKKADEEVRQAKAYLKHAQNTRNAIRIRNMLDLTKPALVIPAGALDANAADLNTPSCIVDLTTGNPRPHDRTAYCSQMTAAAPGTKGAEMWSSFLETITQGDGSIRGFLQMVAGMSLYGTVYHEGIILAYGGGRNGKSTFFNALAAAVGDYTGSIAIDTLTTNRNNKDASLATLRGKRLVITGELEEHQRLSVAMLKRIASTDKLVVEEKYRQAETVKPSHTLVLFTNHLPRVGSTDSGTWRRLTVVPFNATIPAETGVANYAEVLAQEAGPAILSWAIEGAVNFARNQYKLDIPEAVEEATDAYREREDWLTNFISERCVREPNARVGAAELYREYRSWAEETGDFVRRLNDFAAAMETAGFQKIRPNGKKSWIGLRLDLEAKFGSAYSANF